VLPHDKALALSAVEVEQLRDLRNRLGRRAVSDKALATLGAAFFQLCERVDVGSDGAPAANASPAAIVSAAASADMGALRALTAALKAEKARAPQTWPATVAEGAPQSILSRRLALAGREPPVESESVPS
jgi:hypothetical protein